MILRLSALQHFYREVVLALGGSEEEAAVFAELFSIADLRGMDWQGLKSLDKHIIYPAQQGIIELGAVSEIITDTSCSAVIDAHGQLGQLACSKAMRVAIDKATQAGVGMVTVRRAGDSGLLGAYTQMGPERDCIAIMLNNSNPYVAPWGGRERLHGLDPYSVAIPSGAEFPILLDTSVTDASSFDEPERYERPYPPPEVVLFNSVREYGLAIVIETLVGGLAEIEIGRDKQRRGECGVVVIAMHIPHFTTQEGFTERIGQYVRQIKESERAEPDTEILLPGERGYREAERRTREGIPVPEDVWQRISTIAGGIGVDAQAPVSS